MKTVRLISLNPDNGWSFIQDLINNIENKYYAYNPPYSVECKMTAKLTDVNLSFQKEGYVRHYKDFETYEDLVKFISEIYKENNKEVVSINFDDGSLERFLKKSTAKFIENYFNELQETVKTSNNYNFQNLKISLEYLLKADVLKDKKNPRLKSQIRKFYDSLRDLSLERQSILHLLSVVINEKTISNSAKVMVLTSSPEQQKVVNKEYAKRAKEPAYEG